MATKTTTTPLDPARVIDIAREIRGAVTPFTGANATKVEAGEVAQAASEALGSLREQIMVTVADLSQAGQWTEGEVSMAAAKAAAMSNNAEDKALATFIGETKRAMHPKVRAHVATLLSLRDLCWTSETEMRKADKDAPTPLRKAFQRQYHMLIAMFGEAQEGRVFTTAADVQQWAEENDPDLDLDKVMKRLTKIAEQLGTFYRDWPVDDLQVCIEAIREVDKKALKRARAGNVVEMADVKAPVASKVVAPAPTTVVETTEADDVGDIASGAVDILDDVLGVELQAA